MAIIVEKFPFTGPTGQCLILDSRERLVYPFDLGNYSEIRVGIAWSITNLTGNNSVVNTSDVYPQTTPANSIYFGLSNFETGNLLPGQSGAYDYIGTVPGPNSAGINAAAGNLNWQGGAFTALNFRIGTTNLNGNIYTGVPGDINLQAYVNQTNMAGATNFAGLLGFRLLFSGNNAYSFQGYSNDQTFASNVSTNNIRAFLAAPLATSSVTTGFFTSGGTAAGNRLMTPNCLLIYMPMLNQRLRIHNIVVENYS